MKKLNVQFRFGIYTYVGFLFLSISNIILVIANNDVGACEDQHCLYWYQQMTFMLVDCLPVMYCH